MWPAFPGVLIVEVTKLMYQGVPARRSSRRVPVLAPALIPAGSRRQAIGPGGGGA